MYSPHISSDRSRNVMENKIGNSFQSEGIRKLGLISSKPATSNISLPKPKSPPSLSWTRSNHHTNLNTFECFRIIWEGWNVRSVLIIKTIRINSGGTQAAAAQPRSDILSVTLACLQICHESWLSEAYWVWRTAVVSEILMETGSSRNGIQEVKIIVSVKNCGTCWPFSDSNNWTFSPLRMSNGLPRELHPERNLVVTFMKMSKKPRCLEEKLNLCLSLIHFVIFLFPCTVFSHSSPESSANIVRRNFSGETSSLMLGRGTAQPSSRS